jgi:hypothetical protein
MQMSVQHFAGILGQSCYTLISMTAKRDDDNSGKSWQQLITAICDEGGGGGLNLCEQYS